ncbi:MAG: SGNH/GDSL hydrolase family protein [Solirubrobacterales bacterium]
MSRPARRTRAESTVPRRLAKRASATAAALTALAAVLSWSPGNPVAGAAAPPLRPIDPPVNYVSIGDSYTAGQGVAVQLSPATPRCRRSSNSYPRLVESKLEMRVGVEGDDVVSLTDASCSAATTTHLTTSQWTGSGYNPPQLNFIQSPTGPVNTDYVSIGLGANDARLLGILNNCRDATTSRLETCEQAMQRNNRNPFAEIAAVTSKIDQTIALVRQRAPRAVILVVGYPALVPSAGSAACQPVMGLTPTDMVYFDRVHRALNSTLAAAAAARMVRYVDTYTPSIGHDACQSVSARWMEPPIAGAALPGDHPNAKGHRKMADAVVAKIFEATWP